MPVTTGGGGHGSAERVQEVGEEDGRLRIAIVNVNVSSEAMVAPLGGNVNLDDGICACEMMVPLLKRRAEKQDGQRATADEGESGDGWRT